MALCSWLFIPAQGITPLCLASCVMSWVGFIVVASPCCNKLWCCTHGSSSYLAQVIVPLCHCWEGSLHYVLCDCNHELHTTTCRGVHVWLPTRLAPCALLVLYALHQGPLVWPRLCYHVSPWVTYPFLKSISTLFRSFLRRNHLCLRKNNGFIK